MSDDFFDIVGSHQPTFWICRRQRNPVREQCQFVRTTDPNFMGTQACHVCGHAFVKCDCGESKVAVAGQKICVSMPALSTCPKT